MAAKKHELIFLVDADDAADLAKTKPEKWSGAYALRYERALHQLVNGQDDTISTDGVGPVTYVSSRVEDVDMTDQQRTHSPGGLKRVVVVVKEAAS